MLNNFQRHFRFYLASFLFGVLLLGSRWATAPLGATELEKGPAATNAAVPRLTHGGGGTVAVR